MLNNYRQIPTTSLSENCGLSSPIPKTKGITLESPAKLLLCDFTETPPTTANDSISVNDALELMRVNKIRALMMVGHNGEFSGVITAMDLMGREPMQYANEAGISRVDVMVKNIMRPKHKLRAITRSDIEKTSVGDVMHTFMLQSERHLLVVDGEDEDMTICGLFSASDFKRTLGITIEPLLVANTFLDFQRVINEQKEVV